MKIDFNFGLILNGNSLRMYQKEGMKKCISNRYEWKWNGKFKIIITNFQNC